MASSANITVVSTANTFDHWRIQTNLLVNDTNEVARGEFTKPTGNVTVTEGTLTLSNTSKAVLLDVKSGARIDGQLSVDTIVSDADGDVYLNSGDIVLFNRATNALFQVNTNTRIDSVFVGITNAASGVINVNTRNVIVNTANTLFQNNSVLSTLNFDVYNTFFFGTNVNFTNTSAGSINVDNRLVLVNTPNVIFANTHSSARFNVFPNTFFHGGTVNFANTSSTATVEVSPNSFFLKNVTISGTEDVTSDFRVNTNKFTVTASTGDTLVAGDLTVSGGDIVSTAVANIANVTTTTLNLGGAATTVEIGAATGTTNINNNLDVDGDVNIDGGDLTVSTSAFNLANTTATTVNFGGAATTLRMGAAAGTVTVAGDLVVSGGDITSTATANIVNVTSTTVNFAGAATTLNMGAAAGTVTVAGDLVVSGGDITSTATANLLNTTTTTLNLGGAATTVEIGAATGTTNINNNLDVDGDVNIDGGDLTVSTSTFNLANATATTVNFAGAATTLNMGASSGTTDVKNNLNVTGDLDVDGGDITGPSVFNVANTSATQVNLGGGAATVNVGSTTGIVNVRNDLVVLNDLTVSGGDIVGPATFNLANTSATQINLGGGAATVNVGSATGKVNVRNDLLVAGRVGISSQAPNSNLTVVGNVWATTGINAATLNVTTANITSTIGGSSTLTVQPNVSLQQGLTVSGNVTVTGNLFVEGDMTTLNVATLSIEDNEIILNSSVTGSPSLNASILIERGTSTDTFLRWSEDGDRWGWSDNGTVFYTFDNLRSALVTTNTTFGTVNTTFATFNTTFATVNTTFGTVNTNMTAANSAIAASNSAHGAANSAHSTSNSNMTAANSAIAASNSAHGAANSAHGTSNSNMTAANSAIAASNSAHGTTNTTFGTVNTTFATLNTSAATQNTAINEAGNLVAIYANNTLGMANANINFNNTATINVAVSANATNKRANVDLTVNANAIVQLGTLTGLNVSGIANISTLRSNDLRIDSNSSYFILNGNASFNNLDVRGNLVISGTSTNDTDTLVLRAAAGSDGDGIFRVKRGSTGIGNAEIRFFAASNVWQMTPNANAAPSYYTVITTQNVVDSVSSTSTTDAAAPNSVKTAYDQATNARNQANTARSDANTTFATVNTTFGTTNTTFATINSTFATLNTADSNRVLKAGDTMTGNLTLSGATLNTSTANISTIITGNALSLSTGTGSNSNVVISANGTEYIRLTNVGRVGIGTTTPNSNLTIVGNVWATTGINAATLNVATANITSTIGGGATLSVQPNVSLSQSLTVSGNVTVTGNLFVEGDTTTFNVATLSVEDNEIILNSSTAGVPSLDASIRIDRGTSTDTFLRWSEAGDRWGWSDDGTTFYTFDNVRSGLATSNSNMGAVNSAIGASNSAHGAANSAIGASNSAHGTTNTTFATVNTTFGTVNTAITNAHNQANAAYGQANAAYGQANAARSDANTTFATLNTTSSTQNTWINNLNTATGTINSHLGTINTTFGTVNTTFATLNTSAASQNTSIASAANTARVSANGGSTLSANQLNFINTSSIIVSVVQSSDGTNANISFTTSGASAADAYNQANAAANLVAVYANGTLTYANANVNFNNTSTVNVSVTQNTSNKYANVEFTVNSTALGIPTINSNMSAANSAIAASNSAHGAANSAHGAANSAISASNSAHSTTNTTFSTMNTTFSTMNATFSGNMTGTFTGYRERVNTATVTGSTFTCDLSGNNVFDLTLQAPTVAITLTNVATSGFSRPATLILRQPSTSANVVTFANTINWSNAEVPVLASGIANKLDMITIVSVGGAIFFGSHAMANVSY